MSKVNLRRLAKRIHQGLSKDLSLMQIQHLIAQAHGHDSWDSVLVLEKDERAKIYVESTQDGKNYCYLGIDGHEAKIERIDFDTITKSCYMQIGPPEVPFKIRRSIEQKFPYIDVYRKPADLITKEFGSLDKLIYEAANLKASGHDIFPCDNPTEGCIGVAAVKYSPPDIECPPPEYTLQYYPYGKLQLISEEVDPKIVIKLFTEEGYFNCDNPMDRTLGMIKYGDGKAHRYFCRISKFKDANLTEAQESRVKKRIGRGPSPMKDDRMKLIEALDLQPPADLI